MVGAHAVLAHLRVGFGIDAQEVTAACRIVELNRAEEAFILHIEGHDALVAFARVFDVADFRGGGVVVERYRFLLGVLRTRNGGRAREGVRAVRQLLAALIHALEHGLNVHEGLGPGDGALALVVVRLTHRVGAVLQHRFARGVLVRPLHVVGVAQHAGERRELVRRRAEALVGHDHLVAIHHGVIAHHEAVHRVGGERVQAQRVAVGIGFHRAVDVVIAGEVGAALFIGGLFGHERAVEHGHGAPVAVEAHERHGQVNAALVALDGLEQGEAIHERAVGGVRGSPGFEDVLAGDAHSDAGGAVGGHGHGVAGQAAVGHADALARPILGGLLHQAVGHLFGKRGGVERVGVFSRAGVVQRDGETPLTVRAIAQVGLRTRGLLGAFHRGVDLGGGGGGHVRYASALVARRDVGIAVGHGLGRAHKQLRDDIALFGIGERGELGVFVNVLAHLRGNARHLRRRHGRAGHVGVLAVQNRRVHVTARSHDFGLQLEVGRDAPTGEVGGIVVLRGFHQLGVIHGDGGVLLREQGFAGLLADGERGNPQVHVRRAVAQVAGLVVVDDDGSDAALETPDVGHLLAQFQFGAIGRAALHQHERLGPILIGVLGGKACGISLGAVTAVHNGVFAVGNLVLEALHGGAAIALQFVIGNLRAVARGDVGALGRHVCRGHGESIAHGSRRGNHGTVGVGGVGQVGARLVAQRRGVGVARSRIQRDARRFKRGEGVRVGVGSAAFGETGIQTERHVHGIDAKSHHVIESGDDGRIGQRAVAIGRNLHEGNLRVGRGAANFAAVGRGDAGHVRAVLARRGAGVHVVVAVHVVVGKGNLLAHVGAHTYFADDIVGFCFGERDGFIVQIAGEGFVIGVQAGVDDGHKLAFAGLLDLVRAGHHQRVFVSDAAFGILGFGYGILGFDEGVLHAVEGFDIIEDRGRGFDGEAINDVVVVVQFLHGVVSDGEQGGTVLVGLGRQFANLVFEVGVAILLRRSENAAEKRGALAAALLELDDDGDVALCVNVGDRVG